MRTRYIIILTLFLAVIALSGCSKGGDSATATPPEVQSTTLNGMVSKGPIGAATVKVYAVNFGVADTSLVIGQGQTDTGGNYNIDLGQYQGPVLLEVAGGSFTDEVSGASVALNAPLHTIIPDAQPGATITAAVTPMTELAFRKAKGAGQLTADSINTANAAIASLFGLKDIVSILPTTNNGDIDQKKYAFACGTFSQLLNDNKGASESLDDALVRLIGKLGDEEETGGKLSTDSTVLINGAISNFSNSVSNVTGETVGPLTAPTAGVLRLTTAGTPFVIFGIDTTIALPAGVIVDADPLTGEVAAGVVSISGAAAVGNNNLVVAKYTPASIGIPALLHIVMANDLGFGLGEFASIQFQTTTGATFPLSNQFFAVSFFAKGFNGAGLVGVTAAPLSVEGI